MALSKVRTWLGIGAPGGLDDLFVRAVKVAILAFVGVAGADALGWLAAGVLATGGAAALAGFAGVFVNAVLLWASKGHAETVIVRAEATARAVTDVAEAVASDAADAAEDALD